MARGLHLEDFEVFNAEVRAAAAEGRQVRFKNPQDVFNENPNLDSYIVEKSEDELTADAEEAATVKADEQKALDEAVQNVRAHNERAGEEGFVPATTSEEVAALIESTPEDVATQEEVPTVSPVTPENANDDAGTTGATA